MSRLVSSVLRVLTILALSAILASTPHPAPAMVLLKPEGQNALPLRMKALRADVTITGQFAATTATMVFQNELRDRLEVEFIYSVPPGAVATGFAYWFGTEKVMAQIVEKERAAQIYRTIVIGRRRDPALVEMIDRATLHARIFPVLPNADLKIEVRWVQMLPSTANGAVYELPLKNEVEGKGTLDKIQVQVRIQPDTNVGRIANNFNLPVTRGPDGYHLGLSELSYRPQLDLRVELLRPPAPLRASLWAAPAGGADGFFALALTPDQPVERPQVVFNGVRVYDVLPSFLPNLKPHQALLLCGRYHGSGVDGDADTARVFALLPWGDKVELKPSASNERHFFALAPLPAGQAAGAVTFVLTDRAHNRSTLTVEVAP